MDSFNTKYQILSLSTVYPCYFVTKKAKIAVVAGESDNGFSHCDDTRVNSSDNVHYNYVGNFDIFISSIASKLEQNVILYNADVGIQGLKYQI